MGSKDEKEVKFDPSPFMQYLNAPCPFAIGTDERFAVQRTRAIYIRPIHVDGDCLDILPEFMGAMRVRSPHGTDVKRGQIHL
jgi:hypothetical protein